MADKFVTAHAGAKKAEARVNDIFAVRQSPGEGLRDFLARFNRVRMNLPNVSEGMGVAAFQNGLNKNGSRATRKLLSKLMKYPPTTWEEIHNAYCAKVRADEDDLNGPTQRYQPYVKTTIPPSPRHTEGPSRMHTGTQQNEREIVYALKKLDPKVKWPQKMKSDPSTRKSNVLCEFHQEQGHKTEDCIALRQKVVNMLHQGHLREVMRDQGRGKFGRRREQHQGPPKPPSPAGTIQMIIGGGDEATINHVKFTTTHKLKRSITHERYDDLEDSIIFNKSDTYSLTFPHLDALVITLRI
ncbi:PREDICTED: uncharacterized protein LOC109242316 [Nicotiana attenuata]|uniref:uncharacterized protein LOC109242316 n=1 Tax=Nicotiana attenuata TaxID=49451 RepID=UPI000905C336|nr:PREDICTED: uncharacterized protein LOC109242316 [Nicotiana attenuata]